LFVTASSAERLAFVEQSPAAVAAHDKGAWLALFARYSLVEDPVGSRPCVSRPGDSADSGPLSRFYDTFIAANAIRFVVERDMVGGNTVVRDLSLEITMAGGARVVTPMHLVYELVEEEGALRVFRLAAHWELRAALKQRSGGMGAFWRMLRYLGVGGVLGFMRALSSVGDAGKAVVGDFQRAFNGRQSGAIATLFAAPDLQARLLTVGETLPVSELLQLGDSITLGKTLAAGDTVSTSFELVRTHETRRGVAFFHFDRSSMKLTGLDIYWCESGSVPA
jgi:hypothetical protein